MEAFLGIYVLVGGALALVSLLTSWHTQAFRPSAWVLCHLFWPISVLALVAAPDGPGEP
jgi:hypothetical protein